MPDETPGDPALPANEGGLEPASNLVSSAARVYEERALAAEARLAEVVAAYRELKKDTEAYRERLGRDIERRHERKRDHLVIRFIEIVDNLERALDSAQTSSAHPALIEGLILVRTQLIQILQDQGLSWIPVRGLPFDPECSEVVDMEPVDDPANDQVVTQERLRGYRLNGHVVRHAQVVVGQHCAQDPAAAPSPIEMPAETSGTVSIETPSEPRSDEPENL